MPDLFNISLRSNIKEISKQLSGVVSKQLKFATAIALTELAKEVMADESENIGHTFNKPKAFTKMPWVCAVRVRTI